MDVGSVERTQHPRPDLISLLLQPIGLDEHRGGVKRVIGLRGEEGGHATSPDPPRAGATADHERIHGATSATARYHAAGGADPP